MLNSIVQDGLKVVSNVLHKIRQSVAYVGVTESRTLQLNVLGMLVILIQHSYCVTRWNSTFIMLQSAINYRCAFIS